MSEHLEGATARVGAGPHAPADGVHQADLAQSMRNAVKLGLSLLGTWGIALAVRIYLPRHLGPALFGTFQFADAFTTTLFVLTTLGIDTYIRKEIPVRLEHASEFFAGVLLIRLVMSAVLLAVAALALVISGRSAQMIELVLALSAAQVLVTLNNSYAALLHSANQVDGLSVLNIASKALWGGGIFIGLMTGGGVLAVGVAMLVSEVARTAGLAWLSRSHVGLRFVLDASATRAAVLASLPFYFGGLVITVYSRIDSTIMAFLTNDVEVGWYGAASTIAGMSMLLSPLIGWVLLPLTSRAAARSTEELMVIARRAMEAILTIAFPVTLALLLGADVIVLHAFGASYAPSIASLRLQAPTFVLTYATMVGATILVRLDRSWEVSWICLGGLLISVALNFLLIPRCLARYGPGGAGIGAGICLLVVEIYTVAVQSWLLGARAFDRRTFLVVAKTLAICVGVAAADRALRRIGDARLLVDGVLYLLLAIGAGAIDIAGARELLRSARTSRTRR